MNNNNTPPIEFNFKPKQYFKCSNCGEEEPMSNFLQNYISESHHNEVVNELKAENERLKQQTPQWISVEDRLPEDESDLVLFWSKKHGMPMVGCYDYELSNWIRRPWHEGYESLSFEEVTHWMPLKERPKPQPPKSE